MYSKEFNNCYILLSNISQTLENTKFIAGELSLIVPSGKRSSTKGCAGTVRALRCQYHHECLCTLYKKSQAESAKLLNKVAGYD